MGGGGGSVAVRRGRGFCVTDSEPCLRGYTSLFALEFCRKLLNLELKSIKKSVLMKTILVFKR